MEWAETGGMGLAAHCCAHTPPVYVEIKSGADPVKVCKNPMPLEAKKEGHHPTYQVIIRLGSPLACAIGLEHTFAAC